MRVNYFLQQAKQQLRAAEIDSWALDAELLLCHVLKESREFLLRGEGELTPIQQAEYEALVLRRITREPISQLLGVKEFWGRNFVVTADTLAPRPDSETLIESLFQQFSEKETKLNILDIGVGTGCLLLTLLSEYPNSTGVGVDVSNAALDVAQKNAERLMLAERSQWLHVDASALLAQSAYQQVFDLVVTNPPYIPSADIAQLAPEVKDHEPMSALDGGRTGLECYRAFAKVIFYVLKKGGVACIEAGVNQASDIRDIMRQVGLTHIVTHRDLVGIERAVLVRKG